MGRMSGPVGIPAPQGREEVNERIETQRTIAAPAADIFRVLCDPQGHVAIDASGMLQDAEGEPVAAVGDSFVVHMDREPLNDFPQMGKIVTDERCGLLVDPTRPEEIAGAIEYFYNHADEAAKMRGNALRAAKDRYNFAKQAEKLVKVYQDIR